MALCFTNIEKFEKLKTYTIVLQTPSSPARLVGNLMNSDDIDDDDEEEERDVGLDSSCSSLLSGTSSNPSIASLMRLHGKPQNVRSPATSSEISEAETAAGATPQGANKSGLRRGKPNTMRTGLPSPAKRRSMDPSNVIDTKDFDDDEDDDDEENGHCPGLATVDTSPIQSDAGLMAHRNLIEDDDLELVQPLIKSHPKINVQEAEDHPEEKKENVSAVGLTRQSSTLSVMSVTESDHDRAFINESMLAELDDTHQGPSPKNTDNDGFKMPAGVPKTSSSQGQNTSQNSSTSDTSASSVCTVIYNGKPVPSVDRMGQSKSDSQLSSAKSVESIDSGIGSEDGRLSMSLQSIESSSSGIDNESPEFLQSVSFDRQPSVRGRPNLHLSSETQNILSRAGIKPEESQEDRKSRDELKARHESPLRFPQSNMRTQRGVSPLKIPSIFAKADEEAAKYREMGRKARRDSPQRKPILPIGTGLVNAGSVQNARIRLNGNEGPSAETSSAGHTPKNLGSKSALTIKENGEPATPKIKPMLLSTDVTKRVLAVVPPNSTDTPIRKLSRSPMKPVKRLQGSPKSPNPRRYSNSPKKVLNKSGGKERLSPLPKHLDDEWDV